MSLLSLLSLVFLHQKQLNCLKTRKAMLSEGTCEGLLLGAFAFAECTPYRQVGPLWLSRQTQDVPSSVCLLWYLFWNFETFEASHDLHVKPYAWSWCAGGWAWCSYLCCIRFLLQQLLNLLYGGFTWESLGSHMKSSGKLLLSFTL